MVEATSSKGCEYLVRIPSNVKFFNETQLDDGSYFSEIYPSCKLIKKRFKPRQVRVIEYIMQHPERPEAQIRYRLIRSFLEAEKFPAQLLAGEYHQRWEVENMIDELKVHLLGRKTHIVSQITSISGTINLWFTTRTLGCTVINFSSSKQHRCFTIASLFYWNITSYSSRSAKIPAMTTTGISFFLNWLTWEMLDKLLSKMVHRNNSRVVKKPGSRFRSKQVKYRGTGIIIINPPVFIVLSTASPLT